MLRYYDPVLGHTRFKRRVVWAACAFCLGLVLGFVVACIH
jgi:hypothetical protein